MRLGGRGPGRRGESRTAGIATATRLDPHTACGYHALGTLAAAPGARARVVLSTASPYKFPRAVAGALGLFCPPDDFACMKVLEKGDRDLRARATRRAAGQGRPAHRRRRHRRHGRVRGARRREAVATRATTAREGRLALKKEPHMIKTIVPATNANLGIGYDTLGMAVSLYSHFTFERADTLETTGCPEEFQNEDNLVYVSFADALREWGEEPFPVRLHIETEVPAPRAAWARARPAWSRASWAAAALTGHTVDRAELVRIATAVEGHPDNVAPAILGGAVCSFTARGRPPPLPALRGERSPALHHRRSPVRGAYEPGTQGRATAGRTRRRRMADGPHRRHDARPGDGRPRTHRRGQRRPSARALSPSAHPRLRGDPRHMPGRRCGTLWISGSGSTLMAVTDDTIVAKFLQVRLREAFPACETHILTCDTEGAQIEYL